MYGPLLTCPIASRVKMVASGPRTSYWSVNTSHPDSPPATTNPAGCPMSAFALSLVGSVTQPARERAAHGQGNMLAFKVQFNEVAIRQDTPCQAGASARDLF
eukprot:1147759-Pelagomonas_calceolata.AAC.3